MAFRSKLDNTHKRWSASPRRELSADQIAKAQVPLSAPLLYGGPIM
jgi:hypothetical protein